MIYALFDTQDKLWMGDTSGPIIYKDPQLARLAAMVVAERMNWPQNRIEAQPYDNSATKMRDEVEFKRTTEEALARLESGRV